MVKLLVLGVVVLCIVCCIGYSISSNIVDADDSLDVVYQGPVPQGYDLEHFSKTGETINEVSG